MSILDNLTLQSIDLKTPTSSSGSFYFYKTCIRRKSRSWNFNYHMVILKNI